MWMPTIDETAVLPAAIDRAHLSDVLTSYAAALARLDVEDTCMLEQIEEGLEAMYALCPSLSEAMRREYEARLTTLMLVESGVPFGPEIV